MMSFLQSRQVTQFLQGLAFALAVGAILACAVKPAPAATWDHLNGPFAASSQRLERANFARHQ